MNHVAAIVGGLQSQQKVAGQAGTAVHARVARAPGAGGAVPDPPRVHDADVLRQAGDPPAHRADRRARSHQDESAARPGFAADGAAHRAAWSSRRRSTAQPPTVRPIFSPTCAKASGRELDRESVRIDPYRRNLQRVYLGVMGDKLNGRQPATDDGRPLARGELRALDQSVRNALVKAADRATRFHLEDVRDQIARMLDPKFVPPSRRRRSCSRSGWMV